MAYCVHGDVSSEFKDLTFDGGTHPTSAEITAWIAQADAWIDSKLGKMYSVPITATSALPLIRMISVYKVAARAERLLEIRTGTSDKEQTETKDLDEIANTLLQDILDEKVDLEPLGASRATSHAGIQDYSYSNDIEAEFDVTTDNW